MSDKYSAQELSAALHHLQLFRAAYGHLVVFPDVVTVEDVAALRLDTAKGPQRVGDVCTAEEIKAILHAFENNPCADPTLVAQYALNDYRETNSDNKE